MKWAASIAMVFLVVAIARADGDVDYARQIKPVLQARCYACHGALKQQAKLRLDTASLAIRGGESGPAVVAGNAEASEQVRRVSAADESERMPPEGEPLKPAEIAAIRAWIAQGAKAPPDELPERDPRDHWAFKPAVRPVVPTVANADWSANPIDAFLAAEHEARGLTPQRPADKRLWLRRVTLDLVGLPPTRAELDAFVADASPAAYDKVVSRLLDSPHYGERWGRHWLDIWRYSDWWGLGAEVRNSQKHIWHWRDWTVESLNADKGYDQMLREMLAADELYPNDLDRLRASGFLARQYFRFNRTTWLDGTVEHTAKAMLGLTFNCAKCHDHKYDPFRQVEYYQMRAFFEPYQVRIDSVPGVIDFEQGGIPRAFDCNLDTPTHLHVRGDDRNPDQSRAIEPKVPEFLAFDELKIEPVMLPLDARQPGLRPFVVETHLKLAEQKIAEARAALDSAKAKLTDEEATKLAVALAEKLLAAAETQPPSIQARAAADRAKAQSPPAENLAEVIAAAAKAERVASAAQAEAEVARAELGLSQAKADKKAEASKKLETTKAALEKARKAIDTPGQSYTSLVGALKTPESNLESEDSRRKPFPATSTGRRTALAKWITDPRNPLPARVAVNHIWMRHFGRPLVPTVFDFGRKGTPPTHPALLDWLAVELVEHGWSMKHIHRLVVTSRAYRLSSSSAGATPETLSGDPENRYYWRANPVRMEAQAIRDSLLHLAGDLDLTLGGPSIPANNDASRRRSLYFFQSHNEHHKFLETFDDANVLECYRRAESIVPQQALALENSPLAVAAAQKIAQRIAAVNPQATDAEFVADAFVTVLAVEPTAEESAASIEALAQWTAAAAQQKRPNPAAQARTNLVHALLNHNDLVTIR